MYYVIQENLFREPNYDILIKTLDRVGLDYEIVKVRPFIEEFEFKTDRKDVFCFGSVKMSRVAKKYDWYPGSLLNENHDYRVYSEHYKHNLLNYDSKVQRFGDDIKLERFFARPCEDNKTFTGKVYDIEEWNDFKQLIIDGKYTTSLDENTEIQISTVKEVTKEWRFWIVDGQIITGSLYRAGDLIFGSDVIDDGAKWFCLGMVSKMDPSSYRLAEAFVMDICEVLIDGKPEYKIVECGCINSAGFYKADMQKLIYAIETKFNPPTFDGKCYPIETPLKLNL